MNDQQPKKILVTGATGQQGGAVARWLLAKNFKVKALVRNPDSEKALLLRKAGAQILMGNLDDPSSYEAYLAGVYGVFSVQTFTRGTKLEIRQGKQLAELSLIYGVEHFIYSSISGADLNTGIPQFDSKFQIENHIKKLELPYTIIRPALFFENLLSPSVRKRIRKGSLVMPVVKDKVQQFISTDDIGKIASIIFEEPKKYIGKTINLASEQLCMSEMAGILSEILQREITYSRLSPFITRITMGSKLAKMFKWVNSHDAVFLKDIDSFKKQFPELISLKVWARERLI